MMVLRLALVASLLTLAAPALAQDVPPERFLLVLGHNGSDVAGVADLRYADDDAARYYELLAPGAAQAHLLTAFDDESAPLYPHLYERSEPPTRERLMAALADVEAGIENARANGRETVLHVILSGHGALARDVDGSGAYLTLMGDRWTQADMVEHLIAPEYADYTHLIVDACNAYFLVQGRGWESDAVTDPAIDRAISEHVAFSDILERYPRVGVLLSTAGAQEVFEWGRYRSGVFSHQLRSALVGAADVDADGRIRYDEVVAYVAAANVAVRNPEARISATASAPARNPDVPLLSLDTVGPGAVLQLPQGEAAHYVFEDERGLRYADVHTAGDRPLQIVLTGGGRDEAAYYLERDLEEARIDVAGLEPRRTPDGRLIPTGVPIHDLQWSPVLTASRSAVADEFRMNLFAVPFSSAFFFGYHAGVDSGRAEASTVVVARDAPRQPLVELGVGTLLGTVVAGSPEVGPSVALRVGRRTGWHARMEFQQAFGGTGGNDETRRRGAVVLGGGGNARVGRRATMGGELLVGNQWVVVRQSDQTTRDNLGMRVEPRLRSDVVFGRLALGAHVGPTLQLQNELRTGERRTLVVEQARWALVGGLEVRVALGGGP